MSTCHQNALACGTAATTADSAAILLLGHPNVGKSVLFHRLTGAYVQVSNYPGTTVEVSRAPARFDPTAMLLDTPGILTLPAHSEDEQATVHALLCEPVRSIVQVGDAKHLKRILALTALLAELGVPMALALNMHDEAAARGIAIDLHKLGEALAMPVLATVATRNEGVAELTRALSQSRAPRPLLRYDEATEEAIAGLAAWIARAAPHERLLPRGLAVLWLGGDSVIERWLHQRLGERFAEGRAMLDAAQAHGITPARLARERARAAEALAGRVLTRAATQSPALSHRAGQWVVHRFWSLPILFAVLYAVYLFVGVFGAGTLVDLLEENLFQGLLNPAVTDFVQAYAPYAWLSDLLVGQYGLWTMGMTYALALILPIVTTFFIAFSLLEDCGYFARLSVLANRAFALLGLNGRAVLPMVLGLGCVTMATLSTRILHTRRERLITTFLMALAIPCSAQLGVVLGLLGGFSFQVVLIWLAAMAAVLLFSGTIAARFVPGRRIPLVTELPPMRLPLLGNVIKKTAARLQWYLVEVIPLFLLGTFIMFVLDRLGVLPAIIRAGEPLVSGWLGLPKEASAAFVMGFLRRDFGATGLFAMGARLDPVQAVVGMVTITLFVPCIASVMTIIKEHGLKIAAAIIGVITPFAFLVGGTLNWLLRTMGNL